MALHRAVSARQSATSVHQHAAVQRRAAHQLAGTLQPSGRLECDGVDTLFCLAPEPRSSVLAATHATGVLVWDVPSRRVLANLRNAHSEIVTSLQWFSPAQQRGSFATASLDRSVRLWRNYQPCDVLLSHTDWVGCLALSQDDATLLSGCVKSLVVGWDIETARPLFRLLHSAPATLLEPDEPVVLTSSDETPFPGLAVANAVNSLAWLPASRTSFLSGGRNSLVKLFDTRDLPRVHIEFRAHTSRLNRLLCHPDGKTVVSSGRDDRIRTWDLRKLARPVLELPIACQTYNLGLTWCSGDQCVASGGEDGLARVYDVSTGDAVSVLAAEPGTPGPLTPLLRGRNRVVHSVAAMDDASLAIVTSSLDTNGLTIWAPGPCKPPASRQQSVPSSSSSSSSLPSSLASSPLDSPPSSPREHAPLPAALSAPTEPDTQTGSEYHSEVLLEMMHHQQSNALGVGQSDQALLQELLAMIRSTNLHGDTLSSASSTSGAAATGAAIGRPLGATPSRFPPTTSRMSAARPADR